MALHLLMDNPIKYWPRSGEDLVDGYMHRSGIWQTGQGYWTGASTAGGKSAAIGLLQWDGVFCPVLSGSNYRTYGTTADLPFDEEGAINFVSGSWVYITGKKLDPFYMSFDSGVNNRGYLSFTRTKPSGTDAYFMVDAAGMVGSINSVYWAHPAFMRDKIPVGLDPLPPGQPRVSHKEGNQWYLIYSNGQGVIYDHDSKTITNNGIYIDDHSGYWMAETTYCKEYDIFFSVVRDFLDGETVSLSGSQFVDRPARLKVYANEGESASFSTITMTPDPCPAGQVATLSVNLLGAQGEPVEGCLVDWSIVEGGGTLIDTQSRTNYLGESTVRFMPPEDPISTRFRAEVTY